MNPLNDFVEKSALELSEILDNVIATNEIAYISEELSDELLSTFIGYRVLMILWNLFYTFCHALLVVFIIGSETIDLPHWCKIIFSIGVIRHIPMSAASVRDHVMEKFSKAAVDLFKENKDQWSRKQ